MRKLIKTFRHSEGSAVTVDWIVLTAAVIGLAVAVFTAASSGASDISAQTLDVLSIENNTAYSAQN